MNFKLKVGDKIVWRFFEASVYTVLEIDLSQPSDYQILLQWQNDYGIISSTWFNYVELNWLLDQGKVLILNHEPLSFAKKIKKINFVDN